MGVRVKLKLRCMSKESSDKPLLSITDIVKCVGHRMTNSFSSLSSRSEASGRVLKR